MNLFPFFKKTEKTGEDTTVNSSDLLTDSLSSSTDDEIVQPTLSLPQHWNINKEQEYVLRFLSNELPPLKQNQISLAGISINGSQDGQLWNVEAFLRSSLVHAITLGTVELLLLDNQEKIIASQEFNLSSIGEIPSNSNLPWIFEFEKKNIDMTEIPSDGWKLAFNIESMLDHSLDLEDEWKEKLTLDEQKNLVEIVKSLPTLKPNEVNITGLQSKFTKEESLLVSILIRNGSKKSIHLTRLPLEIRDINDSVVATGVFELDNLTIKRNTSKPWTFIFPKENIQNKQADMSRWKAITTQ